MSRRAENAFKDAINVTTPVKESVVTKYLYSPICWSVLTGVFIFIYLLFTNPPFVQCQKKSDELTRPKPNFSVIFVWSIVGALIVGMGPWIMNYVQ